MKNKIEVNYSHVKHEFLVRFFEDDVMVNWKILGSTKEIQIAIADFYFIEKSKKE